MLVCTAQPPLSRITSCDGSHHARNSQCSLIKRQHQDSPRVFPYLHKYHHYLDVLVHFSAFVEALRDDGLEVNHHARDMSIPSLHICIPRCIYFYVFRWYQDTPRVLTLMRHCTSLCRMLVCTAQPPLSRITRCDGYHHARNSRCSRIKRQHQDTPRVHSHIYTRIITL